MEFRMVLGFWRVKCEERSWRMKGTTFCRGENTWEHLRIACFCSVSMLMLVAIFMLLCVVFFCLILCVVPDPHHHRDNTSNNLWSILNFKQTTRWMPQQFFFSLFYIITFANETLSTVLYVLQSPLYTTCETSILHMPLFLSPTFSWSVNSSEAREIPLHFHEFHHRPVRLNIKSIWITQAAEKLTRYEPFQSSTTRIICTICIQYQLPFSQFHPHHHQQLICILLHLHDSRFHFAFSSIPRIVCCIHYKRNEWRRWSLPAVFCSSIVAVSAKKY